MRRGTCDSIYDTLQLASQSDTTNPCTGNQVDDIKPSEDNELNKTQHVMLPKHSEYIFVLYIQYCSVLVEFWLVIRFISNCLVNHHCSIMICTLFEQFKYYIIQL